MVIPSRVGLITIHDIYNYGSVLQALATQELLRGRGFDVVLIDYKYPTKFHGQGSLRASALKTANTALKSLLPGNPQHRYVTRYREFKQRHLRLSPHSYSSPSELTADPPSCELYVVGSDQVWRTELTRNDPSFFLEFASKGIRVSFASSFGALEVPAIYRDAVSKSLARMDLIGVREESGRSIVRNLTGRDATVCLDPTLMLGATDWLAYASAPKFDEPYLLCYGGGKGGARGGDYVERLALEIARKRGLKIVRLNGKFYDYFNPRINYVLDAGPSEFLGFVANASFVVARSFHGTIFSILFHKEFASVIDANENHSSRQVELLHRLRLEDRLVTEGGFEPTDLVDGQINYSAVEAGLSALRSATSAYLDRLKSL